MADSVLAPRASREAVKIDQNGESQGCPQRFNCGRNKPRLVGSRKLGARGDSAAIAPADRTVDCYRHYHCLRPTLWMENNTQCLGLGTGVIYPKFHYEAVGFASSDEAPQGLPQMTSPL